MKSCDSSNYWKDSSPILYNNSQVSWCGQDFDCESEDGTLKLHICNGERLSSVQIKIAELLCKLITAVDASVIIVPECFIQAWGSTDETVLNFIQFLLDQHCIQQTQIDTLTEGYFGLETIFSVSYPDCCNDICIGGTQLKLSQHLEKILLCLCAQATELAALKTYVGTSPDLSNLSSEILALKSLVTTQNNTIAQILLKTNCLPPC